MKSGLRVVSNLLSKAELESFQTKSPMWTVDEYKTASREFVFKNFKQAWEFMQLVSKVADQQSHHPEWKNEFNKVNVILTTPSLGGISKKDLLLARFMDQAENIIKAEHDE